MTSIRDRTRSFPGSLRTAAQKTRCHTCHYLLTSADFDMDRLGRIVAVCPSCDGNAPPIVRPTPDISPRSAGERLESYVKDCRICRVVFTTQHVHQIQCGRDYCWKENKRQKEAGY